MSIDALASSKIKELDDEYLVSHTNNAKTYTYDSILYKRTNWDSAWTAYNNQYDFQDKADWQSRNYLPKFKTSVRNAKMILKNALIKAGTDYFQIKGTNEASQAIQADVQAAVAKVLEQSAFRQEKIPRGLFRGLLENLVIFKTWVATMTEEDDPIMEQQQYKFPIEVVSAYDLFIDPTNRGKYIIHQIKMDLSDFKRLVDRGIYLQEAYDQVLSGYAAEEDEWRKNQREQLTDAVKPAWRKEVVLLEYWGDVDDEDGNTVHDNVTYTTVNEKYLARKPIPNPLGDKLPPFVYGGIISRDGDPYEEGFGDTAVPLMNTLNEHLRTTLDANLASAIKGFEIDLSQVQNASQLKNGIYPGKVITTKGGMPGRQAITSFDLGTPNEYAIPMYKLLSTEYDAAAGINEFIAGSMGTGAGSATEAKIKTASGMSMLQAMAQEIEDNVIRKLIKKIYKNIIEYNPELFGEKVNQLPISVLKFNFVVDGMSKILQAKEDLNTLFMWIGMIGKTPAGQMINWPEIAKMSLQMINQDPSRILQAPPPTPPMPPPGQPQQQGAPSESQAQ